MSYFRSSTVREPTNGFTSTCSTMRCQCDRSVTIWSYPLKSRSVIATLAGRLPIANYNRPFRAAYEYVAYGRSTPLPGWASPDWLRKQTRGSSGQWIKEGKEAGKTKRLSLPLLATSFGRVKSGSSGRAVGNRQDETDEKIRHRRGVGL